jgi:ribonuclease HII
MEQMHRMLAKKSLRFSDQQLSLKPELLAQPLGSSGYSVAGVDEVGRGALFGPVVAAAIILPPDMDAELIQLGVTDSKLLTAKRRELLSLYLREIAIDYRIGVSSVQEIDRLNILQATFLAMRRAIDRLQPQPQLCLVDGNQLIPGLLVSQQTIVKGDQKSVAIAAASIIAKVWRDNLMTRLACKYPGYDLAANKGYGTTRHRLALQELGASRQHRLSFAPCRRKLEVMIESDR